MFGIGGTELIVILVVALLFLGPDKLPEAAKTLSKGIRDLKKQSNKLQQTIENDERIGGAIRDIKSALRGDEEPPPRKPFRPKPALTAPTESLADKPGESDLDDDADLLEHNIAGDKRELVEAVKHAERAEHDDNHIAAADVGGEPDAKKPKVKLPATAGEADTSHAAAHADDDDDLAAMIRPAAGTVAKGSSSNASSATDVKTPETKHG